MHLFAALSMALATRRFAPCATAVLIGGAGLVLANSAMAQATAIAVSVPAKAIPLERTVNAPSRTDQLIENIQVDSVSARIDEQRFGGETRSISVAPKGGFPVYDVQPASGLRTWKVLGF
jgi:hypothetical protein